MKERGKETIEVTVREGAGKLTGNKTEQIKGKVEQSEGTIQEEIGKIKRKMKDEGGDTLTG